MKRGVLFFVFFIVIASFGYAQNCDYDPACVPNFRYCGCGGNQTRYTLCQGGCSDWYRCSLADTEILCQDSVDNDCDGKIDCSDSDCSDSEGCIDSDNDGYLLAVDCDDSDPNIFPGAQELCNGLDDDCDSLFDEDLSRSCGVSDIGICSLGTETCRSGSWRGCTAVLPQQEVCDSLDNDCDSTVDEGCACASGQSQPCGSDIGACSKGVQKCVSGVWSSCVGSIQPSQELCGNNADDDCDGETDEGCSFSPQQNQIVKPAEPEQQVISPSSSDSGQASSGSSLPVRQCIDNDGDGYGVYCVAGFDCDDSDASVNPGSVEVCNRIDENCNNIVDEHLSRQCGSSDIGACSFGSERCINGVWSGCTAVLPSEERCNNGVDDDCDGAVDEACSSLAADKEIALKQFLDLKFGRDNYDQDAAVRNFRNTEPFVNIKKSSSVSSGKTKVSIELLPLQGLYNVTVFEYIPKTVSHSADNIVFSIQPEIIQSDPLVAWHFAEISENTKISYEFIGEVEDAAEKTSTIPLAESARPLERPWFFNYLPFLLIPVLGFVFIFLVEIAHKKRTD